MLMDLMTVDTGDDKATKLLRFICAHCLRVPGELGDDYRQGVMSMFFNRRYLAFQNDMTESDVVRALDHLESNGYIRTDNEFQHGTHIWLRGNLQTTAA